MWLCSLGDSIFVRVGFLVLCSFSIGCRSESNSAKAPAAVDSSAAVSAATTSHANSASTGDQANSKSTLALSAPQAYELDATKLLAAALPENLLKEGWISLFDGQSLFGWLVAGEANWRVEQGTIRVDAGEPSFLCTSFQLADYELKVDFRCDAQTNSGVFLRTPPSPEDPARDSLELNIAPPDNPFPTGSFVKRQKLEPQDLGAIDTTAWHTFHIRLEGDQVKVSLDDKPIMELTDKTKLGRGHISLQHNQGRIEFRNIWLRPISQKHLLLDQDWEKDWTKSEKEKLTVTVVPEGLHLQGGLGQLQSKADFGDFLLQAKYKLAQPQVNSGIFFRCVRDSMLDGYECQLNHAIVDGDRMRPADAGAGAIFRRQAARMVIGEGTTPTYLTLLAAGNHLVSWVNGVQMIDFIDDRAPHENPRRGSKVGAGPISLQGHDPTTDATFLSISVSPIR